MSVISHECPECGGFMTHDWDDKPPHAWCADCNAVWEFEQYGDAEHGFNYRLVRPVTKEDKCALDS